MSRKSLAITLGILVIVVVAVILIVQNVGSKSVSSSAAADTASAAQTGTVTAAATGSTSSASYTLAQVATHTSASSCWTAINGNVYDVTKWISQHPGGQAPILSLCGTDGSAAFNGQHGGQARPASELASFKIGTLVQ